MTGDQLLDRLNPVEHRLPNGLTLLVREDRSAPVVAIVTHVRAGYFDEPDELVGVSHVLEHMYFKGTERRGVGEVSRATKAAGGQLNAGTIYDHTSYYAVLPSVALETGLELQADALIHSTIDADELRKELQVIIEEVKRKLDNPAALAVEKLYEVLFDRHPMRRWRMGTEEALRRMTRDDVLGYYRAMYRGPNITLVVAGDVVAERVIDRVEALYADLSSGPVARPERSEPTREGARLREMAGDIGRTYAELGWRTPGTLDPDTPALDALGLALGQGRASRLYRGVRERGLASGVDAHNYTPGEIGVFRVGLECESARTVDALAASWAGIDRVRGGPISEPELERVRTLIEVRMIRRLETAEGQANLLAEWHALGEWRLAGGYLDRVRSLGPGDLTDVARRYLDPDRATIVAYRPGDAPPIGWTDAEVPRALAAPRVPPPPPPAPAAPAPRRAERVAGSTAVRGVPEDGVVHYPLDFGRLVVMPRGRAPLVSMSVVRPGGVLNETAATAGITGLAMRSSLKGTRSRDAEGIALETERLGGSIAAVAGSDLLSWSLTVPADRFAEGFDLLADVALEPTFPDDEVDREREVLQADLERLRDDMYHYPIRLLLDAAFQGHPYGHGPDDIANAIGAVTAAAVRRWHTSAAAEPWVFVVGDVDPDRVAGIIGARVPGHEPAAPRAEPQAAWPRASDVREVRRDRAQTAMALGFPGPARNDPDRVTMQLLGAAVSGLGNRLFEELRGRRSLAYTVSAFPVTRRHGGVFVGYIATSNDQAASARDGLLEALGRLRDEPPTEEELERARESTIGAWQVRGQTNATRLAELATALILGRGMDDIREFEGRVRAVGQDETLEAARRWLDESRLVEGIVRGGDPAAD